MTVNEIEDLMEDVVDLVKAFHRVQIESAVSQNNAERLYTKLRYYRDAMLLPEAIDGTDEAVK